VRKGHPLELLIQPLGIKMPVRDPDRSKVVKVAAGRAHTLALTNDGDVFSLGNNSQGQCGRLVIENENYFENRVIHTVKGKWIEENDAVVDIVCGQDHRFFSNTYGHCSYI
jgi:alpha-tubulin suppressor-like RCC1 family protein